MIRPEIELIQDWPGFPFEGTDDGEVDGCLMPGGNYTWKSTYTFPDGRVVIAISRLFNDFIADNCGIPDSCGAYKSYLGADGCCTLPPNHESPHFCMDSPSVEAGWRTISIQIRQPVRTSA